MKRLLREGPAAWSCIHCKLPLIDGAKHEMTSTGRFVCAKGYGCKEFDTYLHVRWSIPKVCTGSLLVSADDAYREPILNDPGIEIDEISSFVVKHGTKWKTVAQLVDEHENRCNADGERCP